MKYLLALSRRGLKREDLSKTINRKIDEFQARLKDIENIDQDVMQSDETAIADFEELQQLVAKMDENLEKEINKFNLENYKRRMDNIESMHQKRDEKNAQKKSGVVEKKVESKEPIKEVVVNNSTQNATKQGDESHSDQMIDIMNKDRESGKYNVNEKIEHNLNRLKEAVQVDTSKFIPEEEEVENDAQQVEAEEVNDFENHRTTKPKKMSTALILMGAGAFLLTWGAVNFFKDRK
jgi:hypothetical protein